MFCVRIHSLVHKIIIKCEFKSDLDERKERGVGKEWNDGKAIDIVNGFR